MTTSPDNELRAASAEAGPRAEGEESSAIAGATSKAEPARPSGAPTHAEAAQRAAGDQSSEIAGARREAEPPHSSGAPTDAEAAQRTAGERSQILEIRWHGRGGQGTKTAVLLLAEAAIAEGRYAQGFSEYGPERMGAPVRGYDRLADRPIRLRCQIESPAVVVVLDETLLAAVDVAEGLLPGGLVLVNSPRGPESVAAALRALPAQARLRTVDATGIARALTGAAIPNTVMLGALVRATGAVKLESVKDALAKKLREHYKLARPILAGNLAALERAHAEVR